VGDGGEGEPVVPVASGLLERLEGAGEAASGGRRLGDIAGEFGGFANAVELAMVLLCGDGSVVGVPAENEGGQMGSRDGQRLGRRKSFQQGFECAGEFVPALVNGVEEFLCGLLAAALEQAAKLVRFVRFKWNEIALDVEIADGSGGAANLAEQLVCHLRRLGVVRKIGQQSEQFELSFDAAGGSAKLMHGARTGLGNRKGHRCFKQSDQLT